MILNVTTIIELNSKIIIKFTARFTKCTYF